MKHTTINGMTVKCAYCEKEMPWTNETEHEVFCSLECNLEYLGEREESFHQSERYDLDELNPDAGRFEKIELPECGIYCEVEGLATKETE